MSLLTVIVISCLVYQVSAGGTAPTVPFCVDCEGFYKNAATLSVQTCDPVDKIVCLGEAVVEEGNYVVTGYCAGTSTNPYSRAERSSIFSAADIICP